LDRLSIATSTTALPAASATSATPSSTVSASAAPVMAATPTTAAPATFLRPRFIYHQRTPKKILSVQSFDRFHRFGIVCNFRKSEAAGLVGEAVSQQGERVGLNSDFREHRGDLFFCGFKGQITEIQFLHDRSPYASGQRQSAIEKLEEAGSRPRASIWRWAPPGLKRALQQLEASCCNSPLTVNR
jgi:hypothetical protein